MLSTSHHGSVACECIALLSLRSSVPATALSTLPHISSPHAATSSSDRQPATFQAKTRPRTKIKGSTKVRLEVNRQISALKVTNSS